uniref:NADH-ubiquinone oxidoreductase chain 3 n=1 Tax=Leptotrombidium deliense TaxID=299467 RepID=Q3C2J4_9ACAR|nr:NADH dehydrogenase subunit 3 [Leptotrombidium deliense]BAE47103.1 NADH dehydrogenase subunit 3 [Leptotrombidium deliense]
MILFLCFILFSLMWFLSKEEESNSKNTPFESGFSAKNMSISFSNQYYLVAILFLVFDLEIVLTFPIPLSLSKSALLGALFFLFFALVLFYEWKFGLLDWIK